MNTNKVQSQIMDLLPLLDNEGLTNIVNVINILRSNLSFTKEELTYLTDISVEKNVVEPKKPVTAKELFILDVNKSGVKKAEAVEKMYLTNKLVIEHHYYQKVCEDKKRYEIDCNNYQKQMMYNKLIKQTCDYDSDATID